MTISAPVVINNTLRTLSPENMQLKGLLNVSFKCIHFIHKIWLWFRKYNLYRKPSNYLKLAAGHTLNWLAKDQSVINVIATSLLIGARIIEIKKEQEKLIKEKDFLKDSLCNPYHIYPKVQRKMSPKIFLSPSTHHYLKTKFKIFILKCYKILISIKNLSKRLFFLSMKTMDALAAFHYGEQSNSGKINELFINSGKCLKELIKNKNLLLKLCKENKIILSLLLSNLSSVITIDQFISSLEKSLHFASKVNTKINSMSQKTGEILTEAFKHMAFGLFQSAGLTELMPNSWVPKKDIGNERKNMNLEKYN